jgi:hypothetical protein
VDCATAFTFCKGENFMTMAPGHKKRGYWVEIIFISILLFLLWGSFSQRVRATGPRTEAKTSLHRNIAVAPMFLK